MDKFDTTDARPVHIAGTGEPETTAVAGADPQLAGARMVVQEMAHRLNNDLAVALGNLDLALDDARLPGELRSLLTASIGALESAADNLRRIQRIRRIVTKDSPFGAQLDLDQSTRDALALPFGRPVND